MGRLRHHYGNLIRAIACVRFTDLVGECSRMGSEIALGSSAVGYCRDNSTISQYVHVPAISRAPFQLHLMFVSLRLQARLEHNVPATGCDLKAADADDPAARTRRWDPFVHMPECLIICRIDGERRVVTPAKKAAGL